MSRMEPVAWRTRIVRGNATSHWMYHDGADDPTPGLSRDYDNVRQVEALYTADQIHSAIERARGQFRGDPADTCGHAIASLDALEAELLEGE